jgi:hypothetical protein
MAEATAMFRAEGESENHVLVARVRARLGRIGSRDIRVEAEEGQITVSGEVPAVAHRDIIACVESTRGVRDVRDELELLENTDEDVEIARRFRQHRWNMLEENWAPSTQLMVTLTGSAMAASLLRVRLPLALAVGGVASLALQSARKKRSVLPPAENRPRRQKRERNENEEEATAEKDEATVEDDAVSEASAR